MTAATTPPTVTSSPPVGSAPVGAAPGFPHHDAPGLPDRPISVAEYLSLCRAGAFSSEDRVELLEGRVVPKPMPNPPHNTAVELVTEAIRAVLQRGWRVRGQSDVQTAESVPQPDLAVVAGPIRAHAQRHPTAADTTLVIEVSDSTLSEDRGRKKRIYAAAGFPTYWIINLPERQVEVYTSPRPAGPGRPEPDYADRRDYKPGESVPVVIAGREVGTVAVADLLP
jgi:Uma2 family endonuclease